jgi:hypothetical protein
MSFGKQSDVHNHLSTKHPLFSHRTLEENAQQRIVEPINDKERFAERGPPDKVEKPLVRSS